VLKKSLIHVALMAIAFVAGRLLSPGPYNIMSYTTKPLLLRNGNGKDIGVLPVGTLIYSQGYVAPDVGFVGFVPVDFGDSMRVHLVMHPGGKIATTLSIPPAGDRVYLFADVDIKKAH
jgi:hypothetical protein